MAKIALKILLSLFAVWHLFAIFVLPNPDSLLYRELTNSTIAYGNLFGFNTTWRFFSPNPLIRLLEYDVFTRDKDGNLKSTSDRYPRVVSDEPNREIYNRKLNSGMFMVMRQMLPETIGPRLCEWHPGAETIALFLRGREFPSIEKTKFYSPHTQELGNIVREYVMDIHCKETDEKAPE